MNSPVLELRYRIVVCFLAIGFSLVCIIPRLVYSSTTKHRPFEIKFQVIAGRIREVLADAEVFLGGQDGIVPQRELNLFERHAALVGLAWRKCGGRRGAPGPTRARSRTG